MLICTLSHRAGILYLKKPRFFQISVFYLIMASAVLTTVDTRASAAGAHCFLAKPNIFSHSVDDMVANPNLRKPWVRNPAQAVNRRYIENLMNAMAVFDQWYRSGDESRNFISILRTMHVTLSGALTNQLYSGTSPEMGPEVFPGKFRYELFEQRISDSSSLDMYKLKKFSEPIVKKGTELDAKFTHLKKQERWTNKTFQMPAHMWPSNIKFNLDLIHEGARPHHQEAYLAKLEYLVSLVQLSLGNNYQTLYNIGILYHTYVNTMPFRSINNSIGMGIVNYYLSTLKLNPIAHGDLDFLAFIEDFDVFGHLFVEAIRLDNTDVPWIQSTETTFTIAVKNANSSMF